MMLDDHKEDVGKFKKESTEANDAQLKTWAANILPVLQNHFDSVQAIKKGM
jgi:putative membrane protein